MLKSWRGAGALAAVIVLAYGLFRAVPHSTRISVLHEDGPIEYLGALSFFIASLCFFLTFRWLRTHRAPEASPVRAYAALAVAALLFFAAGEEISWGQRILGISTPEALEQANLQEETNLHNLWLFDFDEYRMFTLGWYPYVIVAPALAAAWRPARRLFARLLPVLPMSAWPFALLFLLNDVVAWVAGKSLTVDGGYDVKLDFPRVELRESIFAVLTAVTGYLMLKAVQSRTAARTEAGGHDAPRGAVGSASA